MHLQNFFQTIRSDPSQFLAGATESGGGGAIGGCNFGKMQPINVPKRYRRKIFVFDTKISNSSDYFYLEPGLYHSITNIVEAITTLVQERHNHTEIYFAVKLSQTMQKVDFHLADERSGLAFSSMDLGHIFGSNVCNDFGVLFRGKRLQNPVFAYDLVHSHSLIIYRLDRVEYC